jgi:hypothetical protein
MRPPEKHKGKGKKKLDIRNLNIKYEKRGKYAKINNRNI